MDHLSRLAWLHGWYPPSYFLPTTENSVNTSNAKRDADMTQPSGLLDPSKVPLLASSVRDIFYVYGEEHAWELTPHIFRGAVSNGNGEDSLAERGKGSAKLGWSHARMSELKANTEVWSGILARGTEVGMETPTVMLSIGERGGAGEGFARFCGVVEVESLPPDGGSVLLGDEEDEDDDLPVAGSDDHEDDDERKSSSSEGEEDEIDWDADSDEGNEVWKTPFERRIAVGMAL
ncbi:uncharacterized protein AB675_10798 [Cyphellophora attinorum]|uniref:Uncharacterized protein n=1 Tax=Cyphellophora attinorum TaxID=1664694 RepID=A0A0N1P0P9_9EURO|nr:uncharacterized protein AB675_10798 [Phialophora attinorum]KPI40840.1 hypothetical protein AB675_10798 [Phialophora attinorum]